MYGAFFAFVVFEQTFAAHSFGKAGRAALLDKAGKYTYALYCLHIPAMVFTVGLAMLLGTHENPWWVLVLLPPATLALSIGFSLLGYHVLEKPFRRAKATWEPLRAARPERSVVKSLQYDDKI